MSKVLLLEPAADDQNSPYPDSSVLRIELSENDILVAGSEQGRLREPIRPPI